MKDEMCIGPAPCDEECAQLGSDDYVARANVEMRAFIHQLRRVHGKEPEGARLHVVWTPHDFGTYGSISCTFDDTKVGACDYALRCEGEMPERWDEEAHNELGERGFAVNEEDEYDE